MYKIVGNVIEHKQSKNNKWLLNRWIKGMVLLCLQKKSSFSKLKVPPNKCDQNKIAIICYNPLTFERLISSKMVCVLVAQSCLTLCDPMDCKPPDSSGHRILQARILQWVAISFSGGSSWPRDQTLISCIAGGLFITWATRGVLKKWCIDVINTGKILHIWLWFVVPFFSFKK